jgi:lambda repressor-like predicted transcriptional regulator
MTIADRLADMAARHPAYASQIAAARGPADELEAKLARAAGLSRSELESQLRAAWANGDQ